MKLQRKWNVNIMTSLLLGMLGILSSSFQSTADRMAAQFGQPITMIGTYISFFAAGSLISVLLGGMFADRIGKRKITAGAVALIIIGALLIAVSRQQAETLAGLLIMGMGSGTTEVMGSAILTDENPAHATRWMNISQIVFCAGAVTAPVAAVWYCTMGSGTYQKIFLILALSFCVQLIFFFWNGRGDVTPAESGSRKALHPVNLLKNREFRLYAVMIFLYIGYESIAPAYIKAFFLQTGSSEAFSAFAISVFWFSMIAGRFIGVFMNGKEKLGIQVFSPVVVAAVCFLLFAQSPQMRIVGVVLFGFACGPVWPMLFVLSSKIFPDRIGTAYSVMMVFSTGGYMIFPFLLGSAVNNIRITFIGCAFLSITVFGLSFMSIKNTKKYEVTRQSM